MQKSLGARLKHLRGSHSQTEFCSKIQQKQGTYSAWERDEKDPSSSAIALICQQCAVSADWLLGLSATTLPVIQSREKISRAGAETRSEPCTCDTDNYWRELVASQQATIALLVQRLSAPNGHASPAATGGPTMAKTA